MAKYFFGLFGSDTKPMVQNIPTPSDTNQFKSMGFSTPFMNVGTGNLSLPKVDRYYTNNNIVLFGSDNLYPQLLNQMYYTSPTHGACIDYITGSIIGGGYKWVNEVLTGVEKVNLLTFEKKYKFEKMAALLTRDYVIHRRVEVLICQNDNGDLVNMKRLDPSTIRNNKNLEEFVYSDDWSRGSFQLRRYCRYNKHKKQSESLYVFQDETPGQDIYPIPTYNSILNWAFLEGEIPFFQKSNIQNGVFPSLVIRRPKDFSSIEEMQLFKSGIASNTGAENGGKLIVLTGQGIDDTPDVVQISSNSNDKMFEVTEKSAKNNISTGNKIDPSIMGSSVAGSLGNNQQIEMLYTIFEKNVVMKDRKVMEEILNDLVDIAKIPNSIKINDYQIIDKVITDQTKMSSDSGANSTKSSISPDEESVVNDELKGLSAAENSDIYRIIRDHGKGKLNDALAITRLKSYGLTEKECKEILGL